MWQLPPTVPKPSQHSKRRRVIEKVARLTDEIVRRRIRLESDTLSTTRLRELPHSNLPRKSASPRLKSRESIAASMPSLQAIETPFSASETPRISIQSPTSSSPPAITHQKQLAA